MHKQLLKQGKNTVFLLLLILGGFTTASSDTGKGTKTMFKILSNPENGDKKILTFGLDLSKGAVRTEDPQAMIDTDVRDRLLARDKSGDTSVRDQFVFVEKRFDLDIVREKGILTERAGQTLLKECKSCVDPEKMHILTLKLIGVPTSRVLSGDQLILKKDEGGYYYEVPLEFSIRYRLGEQGGESSLEDAIAGDAEAQAEWDKQSPEEQEGLAALFQALTGGLAGLSQGKISVAGTVKHYPLKKMNEKSIHISLNQYRVDEGSRGEEDLSNQGYPGKKFNSPEFINAAAVPLLYSYFYDHVNWNNFVNSVAEKAPQILEKEKEATEKESADKQPATKLL